MARDKISCSETPPSWEAFSTIIKQDREQVNRCLNGAAQIRENDNLAHMYNKAVSLSHKNLCNLLSENEKDTLSMLLCDCGHLFYYTDCEYHEKYFLYRWHLDRKSELRERCEEYYWRVVGEALGNCVREDRLFVRLLANRLLKIVRQRRLSPDEILSEYCIGYAEESGYIDEIPEFTEEHRDYARKLFATLNTEVYWALKVRTEQDIHEFCFDFMRKHMPRILRIIRMENESIAKPDTSNQLISLKSYNEYKQYCKKREEFQRIQNLLDELNRDAESTEKTTAESTKGGVLNCLTEKNDLFITIPSDTELGAEWIN